MENFQTDGGASVRISMMQQDNYPVKMGVDSDLSCTVSVTGHQCVTMTIQQIRIGFSRPRLNLEP